MVGNSSRNLYKAVIIRAMIDSTCKKNRFRMRRAQFWFFRSPEDFDSVCLFAGYNPVYVRNKLRSYLLKRKMYVIV